MLNLAAPGNGSDSHSRNRDRSCEDNPRFHGQKWMGEDERPTCRRTRQAFDNLRLQNQCSRHRNPDWQLCNRRWNCGMSEPKKIFTQKMLEEKSGPKNPNYFSLSIWKAKAQHEEIQHQAFPQHLSVILIWGTFLMVPRILMLKQ